MNIAFITVLTTGSDLFGKVGAISLTINGVFNTWRTMTCDDFEAASKAYVKTTPVQTQLRVEALENLDGEKWPLVTLSEAMDQAAKMIKDCRILFNVWDMDPVSRISSHAYLWTAGEACRPSLRRLEGEHGDIQLQTLYAFDAAAVGHVGQNTFYHPLGRAVRSIPLAIRMIKAVKGPGEWENVPKILPPDVRDRASVEVRLAPQIPDLKLPGVAPQIKLPSAPVAGLKLPE